MRTIIQPQPSLSVNFPLPGSQIDKEGPLNVAGIAKGTDGTNLVTVESVTVQLGDQPPVDATLTVLHPTSVPTATFLATLQVVVPSGPLTITVRAIFDSGLQLTHSMPVIASGPGEPLASTFDCDATLRTTNPNAMEIKAHLTIGTRFSGDRESLIVTDFPSTVNPSDVAPGLTNTVTVSLLGSAFGVFFPRNIVTGAPRDGAMTVAVDLLFHHDLSFGKSPGDSTLSLFMTTGSEHSQPTGHFNDIGTRMDRDGNITLIGDGTFVDGYFGHRPDEASLVCVGKFSPVPFPPLVNK